jgi:hypothetical protein
MKVVAMTLTRTTDRARGLPHGEELVAIKIKRCNTLKCNGSNDNYEKDLEGEKAEMVLLIEYDHMRHLTDRHIK